MLCTDQQHSSQLCVVFLLQFQGSPLHPHAQPSRWRLFLSCRGPPVALLPLPFGGPGAHIFMASQKGREISTASLEQLSTKGRAGVQKRPTASFLSPRWDGARSMHETISYCHELSPSCQGGLLLDNTSCICHITTLIVNFLHLSRGVLLGYP